MPKKNISSVELTAIMRELQFLVGGKIAHIYDLPEKGLLLQVHRSEGKEFLRILPGKFLNLTEKSEAQLKPSGFCMQLRKYLDHASITALEQYMSERIALLRLQKDQEYILLFEFFSKGNIILMDSQWLIIGLEERQVWKDRVIKQGERYQPPPAPASWKEMPEEQFTAVLHKSQKKSVIISLATELGVGGTTAEELCARAELMKDTPPQELSTDQLHRLQQEFVQLQQEILQSQGYAYGEELLPYPLRHRQPDRTFPTFNAALNTLDPFLKNSPYEKKKASLERQIALQQEAIARLQQEQTEATSKGEFVYEHYTEVQGALQQLRQEVQERGWANLTDKRIKKSDPQHKKIVISL